MKPQLWNLLLVGAFGGICSGFFGIGGGIVLIPALVFLYGFTLPMANGTSLVALLLPVGLLGALTYYRAGAIGISHVRMGLTLAAGLFMGSFVGAKLALSLPELWLRRAFALFLLVVAVRLWGTR